MLHIKKNIADVFISSLILLFIIDAKYTPKILNIGIIIVLTIDMKEPKLYV